MKIAVGYKYITRCLDEVEIQGYDSNKNRYYGIIRNNGILYWTRSGKLYRGKSDDDIVASINYIPDSIIGAIMVETKENFQKIYSSVNDYLYNYIIKLYFNSDFNERNKYIKAINIYYGQKLKQNIMP
jgi:hypothetical protein